jgi:two-component sensor histidine kinase
MSEAQRRDNIVLWVVFALSVAAMLLTLVLAWLATPDPVRTGGPVYPRMPATPQSPAELLRLIRIGSLTWYVSILSAPFFVLLSRRLPFEREQWVGSLLVFAAVILALAFGTAFAQHRLTYAGAPQKPPLGGYLLATGITGLLPFVAMAAVAQALDARSRARDRELEAARTKAELVEARLAALTAQLQPHFLFNTLQVLDISQTRFGARLRLEVDIDPETRGALVPFFLLQPLAENALEHGVGDRSGSASVRIATHRLGDRLRLTVADDGPGLDVASMREGIGLRNTRARLLQLQLYGEDATLELRRADAGGLEVSVDIPWRPAVQAQPVT